MDILSFKKNGKHRITKCACYLFFRSSHTSYDFCENQGVKMEAIKKAGLILRNGLSDPSVIIKTIMEKEINNDIVINGKSLGLFGTESSIGRLVIDKMKHTLSDHMKHFDVLKNETYSTHHPIRLSALFCIENKNDENENKYENRYCSIEFYYSPNPFQYENSKTLCLDSVIHFSL